MGAARLTDSQTTSRYPLLEAADAPLAKYAKICLLKTVVCCHSNVVSAVSLS